MPTDDGGMTTEPVAAVQRVWDAVARLLVHDSTEPRGVSVADIAAHTGLPVQEVTAWLNVLAARHALYLVRDGTDPAAARAVPYLQRRADR